MKMALPKLNTELKEKGIIELMTPSPINKPNKINTQTSTCPITKPEQEYIVTGQKLIHKGQLFSAVHNGNSTIAITDKIGIQFTKVSDDFVDVKIIQYGIKGKVYNNIQFKSRAKKGKISKSKKESKIKLKKESGKDEI